MSHGFAIARPAPPLTRAGALALGGVLVTVLVTARPAPAADAAKGANLFNTNCTTCHSVLPGKNKIGPSLYGVVGRRAGSVRDFEYSDAMKGSGITWDAASLDKYLTNPGGFIRGVRMKFAGLGSPAARADIIAFLATRGGSRISQAAP